MNEQDTDTQTKDYSHNQSTVVEGIIEEPGYGGTQENAPLIIKPKSDIGDRLSEISKTDLLPKTGIFLTTSNIVKAFVGLGILASPYGFMEVGYILATVMILINGTLNCYTIHL